MAEYIKDNKKSLKPTSIRFNEVQLKIAMAKSGKKGRQQFVDWLIDRYVNGENPVLERQAAIVPVQSPIVRQEASTPELSQQPLDKVSQFCENIMYADSRKEIEKIVAQAKKELDWKRLLAVQTYATETMERKGFIYND